MPELPEVETVLLGLRERVVGRRVSEVEVRSPLVISGSGHEFAATITGRRIDGVQRKGKALAIELGARDGQVPVYLLLRLGMTGQFVVAARGAPVQSHTHLRFVLEDGAEEIRYRDVRRFGRLRCCTRDELDAVFARLGPDAREISEEQFREALRGRRGAIKSWLINQECISGLGNIYADEALFKASIHPRTVAGSLSPAAARRLRRAAKDVLNHAIELQGTTFRDYIDIEGRPGNFLPRLGVYRRAGQPCRRCHRPIRRVVITGRSSHYCPHCQPRQGRIARARLNRALSAAGAVSPARRLGVIALD